MGEPDCAGYPLSARLERTDKPALFSEWNIIEVSCAETCLRSSPPGRSYTFDHAIIGLRQTWSRPGLDHCN